MVIGDTESRVLIQLPLLILSMRLIHLLNILKVVYLHLEDHQLQIQKVVIWQVIVMSLVLLLELHIQIMKDMCKLHIQKQL